MGIRTPSNSEALVDVPLLAYESELENFHQTGSAMGNGGTVGAGVNPCIGVVVAVV
jgi:hypothetical protein